MLGHVRSGRYHGGRCYSTKAKDFVPNYQGSSISLSS